MKAERPSRTAMLVTFMRAVADVGGSHVPDFHDPTARAFLNAKAQRRLEKIRKRLENDTDGTGLTFARAGADLMALRTSAIDAAVRESVARGARQLVIVGAGYDGRAWRMKELAGMRVFEVDHPATQRQKCEHLAALGQPIANVEFVAVDFERESIDRALERAGHDRTRPTCWIWEGVVMYLTRDAMRSTLANISARSATGSTLVVNYHTSMRGVLVRLLFRLIGEPVRSKWSPEEMAADLRSARFPVVEDSGMADWAKRFANSPVTIGPRMIMRVAVAQKAL
jgi:methyltransferase (TIGR00027 family)